MRDVHVIVKECESMCENMYGSVRAWECDSTRGSEHESVRACMRV